MNHKSKFREEENNDHLQEEQNQTDQSVKDFASVEELLRYDANQTPVPERLRKRVCQGTGQDFKKSWWKRLFNLNG